ncbi:MAG TPA: hypothetical protein VIR30_14050 [Nocardioides sp.]
MPEVVPDQIRAAAKKMKTAADESRTHKPDEIGDVATAMPNSESAKHATTLSTTWTKRFTGWSKRVDDHVTGLNKSAEDWDETDAATRARNEKMARIGDGTY